MARELGQEEYYTEGNSTHGMACGIWGHLWVGLTVVTHVDNEAAVAILNSGYSREGQIMHLVRCLFFSHHTL